MYIYIHIVICRLHTWGSLSNMPAVWIHSQPTILRSTSVSKSNPSVIDGVDVSFSFGNSTLLSVNSTLVGRFGARRPSSTSVAVAAISFLHISRAHTVVRTRPIGRNARRRTRRITHKSLAFVTHTRRKTIINPINRQKSGGRRKPYGRSTFGLRQVTANVSTRQVIYGQRTLISEKLRQNGRVASSTSSIFFTNRNLIFNNYNTISNDK